MFTVNPCREVLFLPAITDFIFMMQRGMRVVTRNQIFQIIAYAAGDLTG